MNDMTEEYTDALMVRDKIAVKSKKSPILKRPPRGVFFV